MLSLRQAVRDFRAWRSIQDDRETLNLDAAQNKEVDANLHRCNDTVEARIKETYCWLLIPEIDCFVDMKTIRCIDVMAKLIQKYGSTVLEQKESPLCATNSKAA